MPPNVQCLKCTTFDAAHKAAYEQCDIIHRDVSVGNIMIVPTVRTVTGRTFVYWVGVLCDWELARNVGMEVACQTEHLVRHSTFFVSMS